MTFEGLFPLKLFYIAFMEVKLVIYIAFALRLQEWKPKVGFLLML